MGFSKKKQDFYRLLESSELLFAWDTFLLINMKYDINIYQHSRFDWHNFSRGHGQCTFRAMPDASMTIELKSPWWRFISEGGMCVSMVSWMAILVPNIWNKSGTVHVMVKRWDEWFVDLCGPISMGNLNGLMIRSSPRIGTMAHLSIGNLRDHS